VASAVFAFYGFVFLLVAMAAPPGWGPCFAAMAGIYGLCFFALVAGYFWARWFAIGVGISGSISGVFSIWQIGAEPVLMFYLGTHLAASVLLWGQAVAAGFDGRTEWRERFHLDDSATNRLGKSVIRAGVSLPFVVTYALAPKPEGEAVAVLALALAGAGVWGLLRMRTWGIAALLGGAVATVVAMSSGAVGVAGLGHHVGVQLSAVGAVATVLLVAAATPFVAPVARYLRG